MRSKWIRIVLVSATAAILIATSGFAQQGTTEEGKRKAKAKVAPVYPDLAKRMNVSGKVKLEVVIAPDGHVRSTRVIGGHPLLVQACQDAIKEWKFMTAAEETTQTVEFDFARSGS
jgi:TonB family protein